MAKKKAVNEPSLRDRLSESFLTAFEADFAVNGAAAIEQLRLKDPAKYAQIGASLIAAVKQTNSLQDFSQCESAEDIGRQLLRQVGIDGEAVTPHMLQSACDANDDFVAKLQTIAGGN
jgi:hypothetical protein